jgi:hypothetical protein
MKKQFTRLLATMLILAFYSFNSNATIVTWPMTAATTNTPSATSGTGWTATNQSIVLGGTITTDYTNALAADGVTKVQRTRGSGLANGALPATTDFANYVEYKIGAGAGYNLSITGVSMDLGGGGSTSNVRADIYWSNDGFVTKTKLNASLLSLPNNASSPYILACSYTPSISIPANGFLQVRIYPSLTATSTSKYLVTSNVKFTFTAASTCVSAGITSVTAPSSSICSGATQTLTANGVTGSGATVTWYSGAGATGTNYGTGTTLPNVGPGTYYAQVTTNCDGSSAEQSITVGTTPTPSFGAQPLGTTYNQNDIPSAISVSASNSTSLQWYSNTSQSTSGATLLVGQTSSTYTPSTSVAGTTWYYCVASGCSDVTSDIVSVVVNALSILTTPTVSDATSPTNQGFTANWSDVSNENSYRVNVYDGTNALVKSVTSIPANSTSTLITGLAANTAYTYKVMAIGDGVTYGNSVESSASNSVRTLNTAKTITTFNITGQMSSSVNEGAKTISVYVPAATDKSSLTTSTITISNYAGVSPAQGVSQDFTSPVIYTVTAEDGSTQDYTVTVLFATSANDYFQSKATGNWSDNTTWQSSPDNSSWMDATTAPTGNAHSVSITGGYTVTMNSLDSIPTTTIAAGSTLKATAAVSAKKLPAAVIIVNGIYEHNVNGGIIPYATWNTGSLCLVTGITNSTATTGFNQNFYDFTFNCPSNTANFNLGLTNNTIGRNVTFTSTGTGTVAFTNAASVTGINNITITGNLIINATGGTISAHRSGTAASMTQAVINILGNFNLQAGTFDLQNAAATSNNLYNLSGNFTFSGGTFKGNIAGGSLHFAKGSGTQTYTKTGGTYSGSNATVVVDNGSTLDVGSNLIDGTVLFTLSSGATLKTSIATGVNGNLTTTGTKTLNAGANYIFNGSSAQVKGALVTTANNFIVSNPAGLTLSSNTTVLNLTNNSGSVLNIPAGKQLTVSTTLTNDGTLNLLSDATGSATILTPSSISGAGTANVQQYLILGRNWYISSPVTGATSAAITGTTGSTMVSYNEVNGLWPSAGETLNVGQGYIAVSPTSSAAVTFSGTLNTGAQSFSLNRTDTAVVKRGFNLVGNPYPSYLNWESATRTNVGPTMWYRSKDAGAYVFATYGAVSQLGTSLGGTPVTKYIPPMQAFWVRVSGAGSGTLAFDNSMLSHSATSNLLKAPSATAATQQVLRLQVSNGINNDEAIVFFNENAANGFDAYDSPKMTNANAAIPEIYTIAGNEKLVINGLTTVIPNEELALGFTTGQSNTFSIKATEFSNFSADTKVYLRDNLLNTEQELTSGSEYSFSSDIASTSTRFSVIFKSAGVTTGINSADVRNGIYKNANNQIIINYNTISADASVSVYNSIGQKMQTKRLTSTNTQIGTGLPSGVYMVTVNNAGKSITAKVILN